MRMILGLLTCAFLALIACTGCSSNPVKPIGCDLETLGANLVTQGAMNVCTCSDQASVNNFWMSKLGQYNLCSQSAKVKGVIGNLVCAPLINSIANGGCVQIPSCSGANPTNAELLKAIVVCQSKF